MKLFIQVFMATWLLCLSAAVHSQDRQKALKSYRGKSSQTTSSSALQEAEKLKEKSSREALDKVEEALGIAIAEHNEMNEARSYMLLAEINEGIQEWKLALDNYEQAYALLQSSYRESEEYKKVLMGLGKMHLRTGHQNESLTFFQSLLAMDLSDEEKAEVNLAMSEAYYQKGDYDNALKVVDQKPSSRKTDIANADIQNQQAKIYARMNEVEKTKDNYLNSLNTLRSGNKPTPQQDEALQKNKEEITEALHEQKRYDDEITIRQEAITYNLENKNYSEVTRDKVEIGRTLAEKGEEDAALRELESAAHIADTIHNAQRQADAYLALANTYDKRGHEKKALSAFKRYSEAVGRNEEQQRVRLTEKADLIRKQKDIEELSKDIYIGETEETVEKQTLLRQQIIIYGLLAVILIISLTSYLIYKNARASRKANQLLALKSLRSQMNPHFIFNALNSVNHFIAQQDERAANQFLSEFSQLMRLVLDHSQEDFITLQKENEMLSLYLKLEHYRFRDKFDYKIEVEDNINEEVVKIPPMLIQPYIENAVWHGLRYKEDKGNLRVTMKGDQENLIVEVRDDGIGRQRSEALKTANQRKHNSTGLRNIQQRLTIINQLYRTHYDVSVDDAQPGTGTVVRIKIPMNNNH